MGAGDVSAVSPGDCCIPGATAGAVVLAVAVAVLAPADGAAAAVVVVPGEPGGIGRAAWET